MKVRKQCLPPLVCQGLCGYPTSGFFCRECGALTCACGNCYCNACPCPSHEWNQVDIYINDQVEMIDAGVVVFTGTVHQILPGEIIIKCDDCHGFHLEDVENVRPQRI